ncbi:TPA: DNA sulfur modification protein DndD [Bacillus pseudomycoides]|nr:DNA sulfur modification protein DndD [Bacillus pseudomycoides]
MLIEQLELENIGAYKGKNFFDLSISSPKQNVILIGGENGAGKTTFLNSIKLGLFGCFGYGYKTENNDYYKRVHGYLNASARKNENNSFSISITFSEVENYKRSVYTFKRSWNILNGSIKENFIIQKEGQYLNEAEKDIFESKLRENFPPKLFDLCLFDGEEISKIINENKLSSYLKELSTVIFNLDLFRNLETDLTTYLQQEIDHNQLSSIENEIIILQQEEKEKIKKIIEIEEKITSETQLKNELQESYLLLKRDFETHGGLIKEKRDKLNAQMLEIESQRKAKAEKVREFIQTLLPFYLNRDLLFATRTQMQNEEKLSLVNQLTNELTDERLLQVSRNLPGVSDHTELANELKKQILNIIQPNDKTAQYIHRVSPAQRTQLEVVAQQIENQSHETYIKLLQENKEKLAEAQKLRKKISTNDSTNEFAKMIEQMEETKGKIFNLEKQIEENTLILNSRKEDLALLQNTITSKQHTVQQSNKTKNTFLMAQNIMKLSNEFQMLQHQKKLQQVQIEATKMLNKLMRKHQYISSIRINSTSFEVTLYDKEREQIAKETLSAGEKEILLLSLIWAMFKCSGRRVPFIFDTLLGRLDQTHKHNILVDFIPSCGEQVLILSTNSEVDEKHYSLLKNFVSHGYLLEFDTEERKVNVSHQYFNFNKEHTK